METHTQPSLEIDFSGEYYQVLPGQVFVIGRVGDLAIEDNPFLHRHFLELCYQDGMWWLSNVGSRIAVTVAESSGQLQSWVGPGTRIPLVVQKMSLVFTAGPTTYEINLTIPQSVYQTIHTGTDDVGQTTVGQVVLTPSQKLLIVALAEPWLTRIGTGSSDIPTSAAAATRLGWTQKKFNRKLDNVCDKLAAIGVRGLKSDSSGHAMHRRSRLVEYAVASQLVTLEDVALLDACQEVSETH